MIVREIIKQPELIENFDWFNDGKDTLNYLKQGKADPDFILSFTEKLKEFQSNWLRKL